MKKTLLYVGKLLLLLVVITGAIYLADYLKKQSTSFGLINTQYGNAYDLEYIDLVGTGWDKNGGISATSTSGGTPTIFQFASSTDETYWDTESMPYPHYYGSTTTVNFLTRNADSITINGAFVPKDATSKLIYLAQYSNEGDCSNPLTASTTVVSQYWWPLPVVQATTTPWTSVSDNTFTLTGYSATTTFGLTFEDINYKCLRLKFYNNSTTDSSYLKVDATYKIKNSN